MELQSESANVLQLSSTDLIVVIFGYMYIDFVSSILPVYVVLSHKFVQKIIEDYFSLLKENNKWRLGKSIDCVDSINNCATAHNEFDCFYSVH